MSGELSFGKFAEQIGFEEYPACADCGDTGYRSSAPDDCPEWERDAYEDIPCHCDAGLLVGFQPRSLSAEEERI